MYNNKLENKIKENIKKKEIDEFKCDICQRIFYRKWVRSQKNWSQINEVSYWTDEGKLDNNKIICRVCLNSWFEKICRKYSHLVSPKKKKRFQYYRYTGLLSEGYEIYKNC